jgi:hydrogenase nickel incorporation protein HypB
MNIVILSITEGEDKPLKYPLMFRVCQIAIISKTDLLPYLKVNVNLIRENIHRINPQTEILAVAATTGEGLEHLVNRLVSFSKAKKL